MTLAIDTILSIASATPSLLEGNGASTAFEFTVTRSGSATGAVSATWTVGGAAIGAEDFVGGVLPGGVVNFADGETTKTITVNVAGDLGVEADEAFFVKLTGATGALIGTDTASAVILNDDTALGIAALTGAQAEGNSGSTPFTFTVTRSGNLSGSASAAWAVSGGSANATDFVGGVLPTGTVTFAAGESSKTVTVNVVGDTVGEADETFNVTLANVTGATVTTATASATILNDDALLNIATVTASAAEGSSGSTPFGFTITRSGNTAGVSSVKWAVSGGSAVAADFSGSVLPSGTVSFAAGETTKTITVNVAGDTALEADESFNVVLSAASGATLGTATASALILNDDAQLAIAAASANMAEGTGASATPFTFTVTRSGYLGAAASANWAVSGGTATAADFTGGVLPTGTVNFAPGESSKTVTVNVAADSLVESNETFNVVLSGATGASLGTTTATGTIVTDDTQLDIKAGVASKAEGNTGSTPLTFTVTRSGITTGASTANWAVSSATADATDFTGGVLPSGTVSFAAGETSKTLTVNVAGDNLIESDETFAVTLSGATGATLGAASASTTILNDDATMSIAAADARKAEGSGSTATPFTFTVTRSGSLIGASTVKWAVSGGTATATDFSGNTLPTGTVSFAAGETSKTITVNVAADSLVEADETFNVVLSTPTGGVIGTGTASGTLLNDDAQLAIAATSASKAEGTGATATPFTFTVSRSGNLAGTSTANWAVSGGTATAADFSGSVLPTGTVSFAAGESSKLITVNVAADSLVEANETFNVVLSAPSAGTSLGTASAAGSIVNDDTLVSLATSAVSKVEGNSASTAFTFTVSRTGVTTGTSSVGWAVTGGTASAADFTGGALPTGTVSFAAGETSKTLTVNVAGDNLIEGDETFTVGLTTATGATIGTATANATILNDDALVGIAATSAVRSEGNSGSTPFTFTVTRSGTLTAASTVNWAVSGGAVTGADFTGGALPTGSVSFAAGETAKTITVNVAGDGNFEGDEAFTVSLTGTSGAQVDATAASATGTILNDDGAVDITADTSRFVEGNVGSSTASFTLTRRINTSNTASINWAVSGGTATTSDFIGGVLPSGTVSFAAGETTKTITVNTVADTLYETDESFNVVLSGGVGTGIGIGSATTVILNDDPVLNIAAINPAQVEGSGGGSTPFAFAVSRGGNLTGTMAVRWAVASPNASGADFVAGVLPSGTITFADGEALKIINVDVLADDLPENDKSFLVGIAGPFGVSVGKSSATVTLVDDDNYLVTDVASPTVVLQGTMADDVLTGGAGPERIIGLAGKDTLTGGGGADQFLITAPSDGPHTITDFSTADGDRIQILATNFGLIPNSTPVLLSGSTLPTPSTSGGQFLYNASNGALWFDRDGADSGFAAVQVATLSNRPTLSASDLQLVLA
ncbi:MAG TPA: Calx-beta domain-containing protein [Zoogloea sp.]|uniref:beta strand repeat-containing protein n=1 Tax=Zoogloea sp. TaxID=49181 RepID=UPI002C5A41C5|nr:Calx-beta domain-containing protein [Zoogloea sp.]HMV63452.1 Calx-beta domain-containing protein [Rhodocyclaceae bacterium]HMW52958.1 Calx-beta domain-containing protein [Rhodocyclaceae bacterium]HMZ77430.1 Calx-beta domain-containing protein [Rhodocyclaceae bacterium]HNB65538.1 Calx-beta domain-containing protein [Rhodocyclaceae bacterium]HNI48474.1 Calx-beta domain-containing protein [Zoogloea sp.]